MPPNPMVVLLKGDEINDNRPSRAPLDLGARIRERRTERGWSLDEAASQTGLSRSSLYKIEKGKMSPTFDALKKLSDGFGLDLQHLLVAPGDRHGDKPRYETRNYVYLPLAEDLAHKSILPFELVVHARSLDEFDDWDCHDTEDFVLCRPAPWCSALYGVL